MKAAAFGLGNFCVVIILVMLKQKRQPGKKGRGCVAGNSYASRFVFFCVIPFLTIMLKPIPNKIRVAGSGTSACGGVGVGCGTTICGVLVSKITVLLPLPFCKTTSAMIPAAAPGIAMSQGFSPPALGIIEEIISDLIHSSVQIMPGPKGTTRPSASRTNSGVEPPSCAFGCCDEFFELL